METPSEGVRVQTRTPCCAVPTSTRGIAERERGVLNAGSTKRTSVVYHGSSAKRKPAARGGDPS